MKFSRKPVPPVHLGTPPVCRTEGKCLSTDDETKVTCKRCLYHLERKNKQ